MDNEFPDVGEVFDEEAWEYLYLHYPKIADSLKSMTKKGADPERIKKYLVRRYGLNREDIATRCEAAMRHLGSVAK